MLVLSRKLHEKLLIGEDIEVVVLSVQGSRVRLGIIAPNEVAIRRIEISIDALPFVSPSEAETGAMVAAG